MTTSTKRTKDRSVGTSSNASAGVLVDANQSGNLPAFLSESELANWLNIASGTLRNWRVSGYGPSYCKISKSVVRYPMKAVLEWLEGCHVRNTSEACA